MSEDPTSLLTFLETSCSSLRLKADTGAWGWRKGIDVFIAPETRCSFCQEVFESNRVYVVDNKYHCVPKQWRLATGESVKMGNKIYHPHAFHKGGGVCMNLATDMAQLLFNSINTAATYHAQEYYWDIGHVCPKFASRKCIGCKRKVPKWALAYPFGIKLVCSAECVDLAKATTCISCFKKHKNHNIDTYGFGLCEKCVEDPNRE